jgi:hypothetical protein
MITRLLVTLLAILCGASVSPGRAEPASGPYSFEFNGTPHLWDVSGSYSEELEGLATDYTIVMEPSGKLTGQGTASEDASGYYLQANFSFIGNLKSAGDVTRVTMNWKMNGTVEGDGVFGVFTATMNQKLEIDSVGHRMVGAISGKITLSIPGEGKATQRIPLSESSSELPEDMSGSWSLGLDILELSNKYSGSATVQLSNGKELPLQLSGSYAGKTGLSKFALNGQGSNRALKMKLNSSVNNGQMHINGLAGTILGQKVTAASDD